MSSSLAVANEFIKLAQQEGDLSLTNMKLQKLVYIAHGFSLAAYDKPLLDREDVYAWQFGPVIKELYEQLRIYGRNSVTAPLPAPDQISPDDAALIKAVWEGYGHHSAFALSNITHKTNTPWTLTWNETPFSIISDHLIQAHYKRILND